MFPKTHLILGIFLSIILLLFFPGIGFLGVLLIFLSSFLIDVDHYLYYVYNKKSWSLKGAYKWFIKRREEYIKLPKKEVGKYKQIILIFHGIECWGLIFLISLFFNPGFFIFFGMMFHLLFDFAESLYYRIPISDKFSQIYVLIMNKNKKELEVKWQ